MGYSTVAGATASQSPGGQYSGAGASSPVGAPPPSIAAITSGSINGAAIGAVSPASGKFTTLETTQSVGFGGPPISTMILSMSANITGGTTAYGQRITGAIQSDVTGTVNVYNSAISTAVAGFTLANLRNFHAQNAVLGSGSSITTQVGFLAADLTVGTNNYGYRSIVSAGANKYGLFFDGTADNYLAGNMGFGVTPLATVKNYTGFSGNSTASTEYGTYSYILAGATSGSTSKFAGTFVGQMVAGLNTSGAVVGVQGNGNVQSAGTSAGQLIGVLGAISTNAAGTVLGTTATFQSTIQNGGSSTFSGALIGFHAVDHAVTATGSVAAFYGSYTAGAGRYNLNMAGTALNVFNGDINMVGVASNLVAGTGGLGFTTGSGGAVTQITGRTTGVTLDRSNGSITLVSAAGTTAWQSFTVTNNKVAATDIVRVCQRSGTDLYQIHVTAVAAGSFRITFATTGGTTVEQPVFSFAVIKAVTA